MKPRNDQLCSETGPELYAGKPTGENITHVMQKRFNGIECQGVMGRGRTLESAIADFWRRYEMEYNYTHGSY